MSLIHSSDYKPKIFPLLGDSDPANIDRAQAIDPTVTLNREKIEEIGREGVVGYLKRSPTITYRLTQHEYGSLKFFKKLANVPDSENTLNLRNFADATFDICAYMFDDKDQFRGTIQYPSLRLTGFSIGIADPDAIISRTFDFAGEGAVIWQGDNKYYIMLRAVSNTEGNLEIVIGAGDYANYPIPVADPILGSYFIRILRVRDNQTSDVTDYIYDPDTHTLTIPNCEVGDIIKVYYTASAYITNQIPFELNDTDLPAIEANSVSIYLYIPASGKPGASDYIYKLQSATIDVRFDREDQKELGNKEVVVRGIREKTVTVTLGRIIDGFTVEEVLSGREPGFGKIDVRELGTNISLVIKFYEDYKKQTFKWGLKAVNLSSSELRGATAGINAYLAQNNTLIGEELKLTENESELLD